MLLQHLQDITLRHGAVIVVAAGRAGMAALGEPSPGSPPVLRFPPWDTLPYDRAAPDARIVGRRLATLASLACRPDPVAAGPVVVVTTVRAALRRLITRQSVAAHSLRLACDMPATAEELVAQLAAAGYLDAEPANDPGEMAVRDRLVDVFPPGAETGVRVEIADGRITALRPYDPASQRGCGEPLREVLLPPGAEVPWDPAAVSRFLDHWRARFGAASDDHPLARAIRAGRRPRGVEHWLPLFCDRTDTLFGYLPEVPVFLEARAEEAARDWLSQLAEGYAQRRQASAVEAANGLPPYNPLPPEETDLTLEEWQAVIAGRGQSLPEAPSPQPAATAGQAGAGPAPQLPDIAVGDLVVHPDHGIGLFDGIETVEADGVAGDVVRLVYAKGDKLMVPAENADLVYRYGSGEARLDHLGGTSWPKRRERLSHDVAGIAKEMVRTMLSRGAARCAPMPPPADYFRFAGRFPHDETADQARAIDEVLGDLASGRAMDRLVCGDVGFGKTEVALRAAFVVASHGAQVAVIAPTAPLCHQHHDDLCARLAGWPWRVGRLCRGGGDGRTVRRDLESGALRLVVGTQALLSAQFDRLGLVVIDEEQRLGVADKERLKAAGPCVHVLTLTATPIPRTLELAATGLRDLSLIRTAPVARRPVRTFLLPFDPVTIRQALLRERRREGQSLVIVPRIGDIPAMRGRLAEMAPELSVAEVHGRVGAAALERVMADFAEGRTDLLLATNIIESGLNLPGANTIVIHRADRFGLSALHQLRGRVGRGHRQAYAYLTTEPDSELADATRQRLETIAATGDPGAGFTLALRDRDLRGAGTLLGDVQAGHLREVGSEYLDQLTRDAVAHARGDTTVPPPVVRLGAAAYLPDSYIPDAATRLSVYRRLAAGREPATLIAAELADRFGPLPPPAELAVAGHRLARACRGAGIAVLDAGPAGAVFRFADEQARDAFLARVDGARVRDDGGIVVKGAWSDPAQRAAALETLIGLIPPPPPPAPRA